MNRQAMAALRARLQQKIAQKQPLTTPETLQHSGEEKEAMSNTAVLDEVDTLDDIVNAHTVEVPDAAVLGIAPNGGQAPEEELSEEEEDDEVVGDVPSLPAALAAPSPREPKARPRRKRHVVGRTADGKCELLYLDVRNPEALAEARTKYDILPGVFKTRSLAEWYIENAPRFPSVKCASDAAKMFKAEKYIAGLPV